ncbi:hypothetical protein L6452_43666 [Arctium lappa]|uniref:Uncharacterized protein n=1 Tax=Arctium lappa TaxID=4217 RepID=A0ACB8XFC1_ARCLA|nr:hypothetical protein L6452_43666 [Arctium lappa]
MLSLKNAQNVKCGSRIKFLREVAKTRISILQVHRTRTKLLARVRKQVSIISEWKEFFKFDYVFELEDISLLRHAYLRITPSSSLVFLQIIQIQKASVESYEEKIKSLNDANAEFRKKISDLEQKLAKDKSDFETKKKSFAKKFSDFSRKCVDEKKEVELKCINLSQHVSDFEKVIILEKEKFAKEKKAIEQKNVGFFKEISGQRNNVEKGFEEERNIFKTEIKKLIEKLSELSECVLKEKKTKSECKTKIDMLVKERDNFASKIKELEKTASSSNQKTISSQRSVKYSDRIRSTNLFYDRNIDGSGTHQRRRRYKEEELVWKKKLVEDEKKDGKKDELKGKKSCVHIHKAKKNNARKGTYCQGGVEEQRPLSKSA